MNLLYKYSDRIDIKNFIGLNELFESSFKKLKEFEYVYCVIKHESNVICKFIYVEKSEYNEKTSNIMVNYFDSKYITCAYYTNEIDICDNCGRMWKNDYCSCYSQDCNKITADIEDDNKIVDFGFFSLVSIDIEYFVYL